MTEAAPRERLTSLALANARKSKKARQSEDQRAKLRANPEGDNCEVVQGVTAGVSATGAIGVASAGADPIGTV